MPTPLQAAIEVEILAGLSNEKTRMDEVRECLDFYRGDFDKYPVRDDNADYSASRTARYSLVMQRVVNVLTANLYASGPVRTIPDHEEASQWLAECYRRNAVDSLMQEADRLSTIGQVAAFQVSMDPDPDCPVKIDLWDAAHFLVWLDPENQRAAIAVATIDIFDERRRLRLWTADEVVTFVTEKLKPSQTAGGTAYQFSERDPNPYGVIPFAFVHFNFPACNFWSGGLGSILKEVNDYANAFLTGQADALRFVMRPVILARNTPPDWKPETPVQPGDIWDLAFAGDGTGNGPEPDLQYLQADLGFIGVGWEDYQAYLDHTLEGAGVPKSAIRMSQTEAKSGVAIVAEQVPLILWAEGRQRPFGEYENRLARLVLTIGSMHLGNQDYAEYKATAAQLKSAAAAPGLQLRWPEMFPDLPGPEQDASDQWLLDQALTSRTHILMRRRQLSRDEARTALQEIADDLQFEAKLLTVADLVAKVPPKASETPAEPGTAEETDPTGNADAGPSSGD